MDEQTFYFEPDGELSTERCARESLPDHLEMTDRGKVQCKSCGVESLRPVVHKDNCNRGDQ